MKKKRKAAGGGNGGSGRLWGRKTAKREHLKLVINNGDNDKGNVSKPFDDGDDFDNNPKTWH